MYCFKLDGLLLSSDLVTCDAHLIKSIPLGLIKHILYPEIGLIKHMSCYLLKSSDVLQTEYKSRVGPCSPWSLCGLVVEHQSAESEVLWFDSSWGLRIFLCPTLATRRITSFSRTFVIANWVKYKR